MKAALSIRQPYAEMILRGIKKIEYRTRPTKKIGETFAGHRHSFRFNEHALGAIGQVVRVC